MKKRIGRLIPYPLIRHGRRLVHAGLRRCEVCQGRVRRFHDSGYGYPVLERLQVVGGLRRASDQCPLCHSTARERLVWFWFEREGPRGTQGHPVRIAHFAPEKGLAERFSELPFAQYRAYDIDPGRYRHLSRVDRADLSDLPLDDEACDLLVCNHVLEHVPDVDRAIQEIARVLTPGGRAVLQVPIALALGTSIELDPGTSPEERERLVGQDDHLRLFCREDYLARLSANGLTVAPWNAFESDPVAATRWRLDPFETLFVCGKAS